MYGKRHSIATVHEVKALIAHHADLETEIVELLWHSVGRVVLKLSNPVVVMVGPHTRPQIGHIADWLKASVVNAAPWLDKKDDKGRPKKLLKFGTVDAIFHEAEKAMRRQNRAALRFAEGSLMLAVEL